MTRVFLSHSSHDIVLARLIVHILEERGIVCFHSERDIRVGEEFDSKLVHQIHQSALVLVVWSAHAAASCWVNQEIGIALAKQVPVWPMVVDQTTLQGAVFRRQGSDLSKHADPYQEITRLADEITKGFPREQFQPRVDQYLLGKEPRTKHLIALLAQVNNARPEGYILRIAAAFSSFGVSADADYRVARYHSHEYHELLIQEREEVCRMARWAAVKVILWPERVYDEAFMRIRFRNLLHYLESNHDDQHVQFVLGRHWGDNRHILDRNALVMGVKSPGSTRPGYDLTTVTYHGPTVTVAINEFDARFQDLWDQHLRDSAGIPGESHEKVRAYVIAELRRVCPAQSENPAQVALH